MVRRLLYVLAVPDDAQMNDQSQQRRKISKEGVVSGGQAPVEDISLSPNERTLKGSYRGKHAEDMAEEFEELFRADAIKSVPFYGLSLDGTRERLPEDGYYALEDVTIGPADPRDETRSVFNWDGILIHKGSKKTHWRAVKTNTTDISADNPFSATGNGAKVYVPTTATKERWFDESDGSISSVGSNRTVVSGEFIDVVETSVPSGMTTPILIYEMPYEDEGKGDTKVWDNRNRDKDPITRVSTATLVGDATVSGEDEGVTNTWPRVFDPSHEFDGDIVVENGVARLVFDEPNQDATAYQYDAANDVYSEVAWGDESDGTDWQLFDVDLIRTGDDRVNAQILWEEQGDGSLAAVDFSLKRGFDTPVWTIPANEAGLPTGLKDKLGTFASPLEVDPVAEKTLVKREDVRR